MKPSLLDICAELSPDARETLYEIAARMLEGQREYGILDLNDDTDWLEDAHEEDLDAAVYRTFHYIQQQRKKKS